MATGEEVWDALPEGEAKSVWDETEHNFWANLRKTKEAENSKVEKDFQHSLNEVRLKLSDLKGQRSQLKESQSRLARELAKVEAELARTTDECDEKAERLVRIEQDYHESRRKRTEAQHEIWVKMRRFFRDKRGEDPNTPDTRRPESEGLVLPDALPELSSASNGLVPEREPINGSVAEEANHVNHEDRMEGVEQHDHGNAETLVNVVDADGNVIGPVEHIEPWNQWVEGIQELEIRRPVKIRRGRRFNTTHLSTIYERSEAKGVKWLSCMIQATGEIQSKRCQSCDKNQGAFDDCIIVGGDLYQKCGNCEWNRQGCHGASGDTIDIIASRERARQKKEREEGSDETPAEAPREQEPQTVEIQTRPVSINQPDHHTPHRVEEQVSVNARPHSPPSVLQRPPERFAGQQPGRQPETSSEQVIVRHPNRTTEPQPNRTIEIQPERRFERVPDRVPEKLHDVISARGPERTVEVAPMAPMQINEHPHGRTNKPIYDPSPVPHSRPSTAPRSDYAPERMIDPVDPPLPRPIQYQIRPLQDATRAALPPNAPQHTPHDIIRPSAERDTPIKDPRGSETIQTPRESDHVPTPKEYRVTSGFTPANVRSRPPSSERGRPTPPLLPPDPASQPPESPPAAVEEEITRENMVLKNDGVVYTYPECVEGVPLAKINENHPYWEPNWQNVRTLIEPQLARWREKHQAAIDAGTKQEKGGSSKYQIGRQVNRGIKILEFHETGPISPYQLLGKKYIQSGKGGITSYDTLFRLSETISELEKFNLDISPVDWMRQRLHELMQARGANFNLPKIIHDFYHDSKLTALRYKHGFKNIGRPSGVMKSRMSHGSPSATPKPLQKRKSMHSGPTTPREDSFIEQSPLPSQLPPALPGIVASPQPVFSTHLNKRPKYLPPAPGQVHDEFHFDAWSDTDSCSGGQISKYDWRLAKVKTRLYTSHSSVTQYWTWIDQQQCFQHQVLRDLHPAKWGYFKDEIDFHVYLDEIQEISWNIEQCYVYITVKGEAGVKAPDGKPRGDVMAVFARKRTMRRFLFFCREKGVHMNKRSGTELDNLWQTMISEQLPGRGDSNQRLVESV
ncbi:uncharacterized protein B0J16DRAFT_354202 [Fusarium flagelliforme]|nr:uncharacterized protein B0J16DRAFT_354202 [Fusarium flagelliforme]KAH7193275.1 hypothetical protein B0J16DRAFT_354202 [Fusarium flagelliforme]